MSISRLAVPSCIPVRHRCVCRARRRPAMRVITATATIIIGTITMDTGTCRPRGPQRMHTVCTTPAPAVCTVVTVAEHRGCTDTPTGAEWRLINWNRCSDVCLVN